MGVQEKFRRWFKLRFAVLYPFGVCAVLFGNSDDKSVMAGIYFIAAGLLLRIWANGYAVKSEKLTTSGPYAFIRHPLYLGTMLIVIGFIIMLKLYYAGILFFAVTAAVYYYTITKEERMLQRKFKDLYADYRKKVPAMFPAFLPYRKGEKWPFSFKRLIKSQEYKLFLWTIILVIAFHLKDEFLIEHETWDAKIWMLIIIAFVLGVSDLARELIKFKTKREMRVYKQ